MKTWNNIVVGLLIGTLFPLIFLFGVNTFSFAHLSFYDFLYTGFSTGTINSFLKLSALFNLAPFFLFINMNKMRLCQGIVFATIIIGFFIVYFTLK